MSSIKVLNFHKLEGDLNVNWFENVIVFLKNKKKLISCEDLNHYFNNDLMLKEAYLLTVDDGHKSFYNNIYPIIKKHNVPITLFISPKISIEQKNFWWQKMEGFDDKLFKKIFSDILNISFSIINDIGLLSIIKSIKINEVNEAIIRYKRITKTENKPFQNMTIDNLIEVEKSGLVTLGAHTMNHPILFNEDDETSKYEIQESINELGNILNQEIKYFAYPNGIPMIDYSIREMEFLQSMDIDISFSTLFKKVSKKNNILEIPRGEISKGSTNFKKKLYLWGYWRGLINIKNGNRELSGRAKIREILKSNGYY